MLFIISIFSSSKTIRVQFELMIRKEKKINNRLSHTYANSYREKRHKERERKEWFVVTVAGMKGKWNFTWPTGNFSILYIQFVCMHNSIFNWYSNPCVRFVYQQMFCNNFLSSQNLSVSASWLWIINKYQNMNRACIWLWISNTSQNYVFSMAWAQRFNQTTFTMPGNWTEATEMNWHFDVNEIGEANRKEMNRNDRKENQWRYVCYLHMYGIRTMNSWTTRSGHLTIQPPALYFRT